VSDGHQAQRIRDFHHSLSKKSPLRPVHLSPLSLCLSSTTSDLSSLHRGCALVTTATSYFYLIAHPNPGDPNEFDISASLSVSERQNLLSPVQMTPSSPTTTTPMRSRSNSDSYMIGVGGGSITQPIHMTSSTNSSSPVPAVYFKHLNGGVPSAIACLADGVTLFVGDTAGSVTWYELKSKELVSESHPGTYLPQARGRYVIEEGRTNVRVLHMQVTQSLCLLCLSLSLSLSPDRWRTKKGFWFAAND
jgi:hypothetical protein